MKRFFSALIILLVFFLSHCSEKTEKAEFVKPEINPNGSSELSLLMRKMHLQAEEIKKRIEDGKRLDSFPNEFKKINSAIPTDSLTKKSSFETFAANYLSALNAIYSNKENIIENYNAMINTCLSCHSDHCPGPIPKIRKLAITEK